MALFFSPGSEEQSLAENWIWDDFFGSNFLAKQYRQSFKLSNGSMSSDSAIDRSSDSMKDYRSQESITQQRDSKGSASMMPGVEQDKRITALHRMNHVQQHSSQLPITILHNGSKSRSPIVKKTSSSKHVHFPNENNNHVEESSSGNYSDIDDSNSKNSITHQTQFNHTHVNHAHVNAEFVKRSINNKTSLQYARHLGLAPTPIGKKGTQDETNKRMSNHLADSSSNHSASSCSADTWDCKDTASDLSQSHSRTSSGDISFSDGGGSWSSLTQDRRRTRLPNNFTPDKNTQGHSDLIRKTLAKDFHDIMIKSRSEELKYKEKMSHYLSAEGKVRDYLLSTERHRPFPLSSDTESSVYSDGNSDIIIRAQFDRTIDDLNDNLLSYVLSKLPTKDLCKASIVCKRWNRLCWTPNLWSSIDLTGCSKDSNFVIESILRKLSRVSPYACLVIHKLKLNSCDNLSDETMKLIGRRCPELKHLEVAKCPQLTGNGIVHVFSNCPNLALLNVACCPRVKDIDLSASNGVSYGENASFLQLRYFDLSECLIDDTALDTIARSCSFMEYLYLRRCEAITDKGVVSVANYCTRVREFSVSDCPRVSDSGLKFFVKKCHGLRYIGIAKCSVTDDTVKYIAKYCKNLRYLNMNMCHSISDEGVARVVQNCEKLRALDVGKCEKVSDTSLNFIAVNCPQLRRLSIKGCDRITDAGLRKLATHCRKLKHLNLQECEFTFETYLYLRQRCVHCVIEHTKPEFF
eukprot:gene3601-4109_t